MKQDAIQTKLNEGYFLEVALVPNKSYTKMKLETRLRTSESVYTVYYNHCKKWLTNEQIEFIELYKKVCSFQFKDKVSLNIEAKKENASIYTMKLFTMWQSVKKMETVKL